MRRELARLPGCWRHDAASKKGESHRPYHPWGNRRQQGWPVILNLTPNPPSRWGEKDAPGTKRREAFAISASPLPGCWRHDAARNKGESHRPYYP